MSSPSIFSGENGAYIEALYEDYLHDPQSVPQQWRTHFAQLSTAAAPDVSHADVREHFLALGRRRKNGTQTLLRSDTGGLVDQERKQTRILELIGAYRNFGHKKADLDPLKLMERESTPILDLSHHHLSSADLDAVFFVDAPLFKDDKASLRQIINALEDTYCRTIGAEYMHIFEVEEQYWIQQRLEAIHSRPVFDVKMKKHILDRLTAAEGLEKYLHRRYPGTKRFGLEGAESLIPMLHETLQRIGSHGCVEAVMGMAHRGRLNVLVNILGKDPKVLFDEFEGKAIRKGSGDVKYHQGFSSNITTPGGEMHLALGFNPSHLEIVGPVVEGSVRARQDRRRDYEHNLVVPILIHGDAAFAAQGVVMETLQMSQTRGFKTGGTIHVIVNNQVGFTTHKRIDARSTEYCSEVAKLVQAPILHVNGDDPEAAVFAVQLAVDYRMRFKKDVVIDLVCYRRRGHNEAEEPSKTQPLMYQRIRKHPTTRTLYAESLIAQGMLTNEEDERAVEAYRSALASDQHVALSLVKEPDHSLFVDWSGYLQEDRDIDCDTSFELSKFKQIAARLNRVPEGFTVHRQVEKVLADRRAMADGNMPINWGFAEIMTYGTLLDQGYSVRLTGQDVGIGTFSHRHACLHDQKTGRRYIPLSEIFRDPDAPKFDIYDSLLSEEGVLAFEYGYSTTQPKTLTIWEAQFGDFANGAQVVIDQFISSGETKWGRKSGLTLFLPHGYEGAGSEHSSARLERYLQLCAELNMQVCIPTTPAQMFHMLRRQIIHPLRKPLIVFSPKSLLRHKLVTSTLDELCKGTFHPVLDEIDDLQPEKIQRLILCSGKVYYDLLQRRREEKQNHIAIIRIEQLYPFPENELSKVISRYKNLAYIYWCQEEPMNQGAWYSSQHHMRRVAVKHDEKLYLFYAGRESLASAASGYMSVYVEKQKKLVQDALFS